MVSSLLYSALPDINTTSGSSTRPKLIAPVGRPIRGNSSSRN